MSWKDALHYVKGAVEKKGLLDANAEQDLHLPLCARIGSLVQLQKTPFIRAISNGSFIEMPTDSQSVIKAISKVNLPISGNVYRYYLALGDGGAKEIFLQIYVNQQGEIGDIIYCSQLTRIIPETEEDQQLFMGLSGAGLGDKNYCLWREQLAELGYGAADLRAAFGDSDVIEYWRDAGNPEQEFIQPFKGSEIRLDDAQGIHGLKQEIYYMPYGRQLKEDDSTNVEYLFITTEIVESQNGDSSKRDIHVDFMVGVAVEQERLVIQ